MRDKARENTNVVHIHTHVHHNHFETDIKRIY